MGFDLDNVSKAYLWGTGPYVPARELFFFTLARYALPYLTFLMAISGVAHPQGGRPAAIFYLFGHPTPYNYGNF
jgi:hypothetical protein